MLKQRDKICILGKGGFAREVFLIIKDNFKDDAIQLDKVCFFLVKNIRLFFEIIISLSAQPNSDLSCAK